MIINLTNHPCKTWSEKQIKAAKTYGEIEDYPFPNVNPFADKDEIVELGKEIATDIIKKSPDAVVCQGEFSLCYVIVSELLNKKIKTLVACSNRITEEYIDEHGYTQKKSRFEFEKFREYRRS